MSKLQAPARVRRWFSQDIARTNAAQACVRLQHDRRQRRDLETYLAEQLNPPTGSRPSKSGEAGSPRASGAARR